MHDLRLASDSSPERQQHIGTDPISQFGDTQAAQSQSIGTVAAVPSESTVDGVSTALTPLQPLAGKLLKSCLMGVLF